MTVKTTAVLALVLAGLAFAFLGQPAYAQEDKQVVIVVTTDDNGELNPCG